MSHAKRFSAVTRVLVTTAFLLIYAHPVAAQPSRPQPSPEQKARARTGRKYFDSLHLKGGSLFDTHYDFLSQACEAEYVVIHAGVTQLSIDDATKRENLAMYRASEKTGKLMKCYVVSTRCRSQGGFLTLSAKVFGWVTF